MRDAAQRGPDQNLRAWFVYVLTDPREPRVVRYVGWTDDPFKRLRLHIKQAANGQDKTRCGNWKRSLLRFGTKPSMMVIENGFGEGWAEAEMRWIAHYRTLSEGRLTNLTDGGEGARGCVRSVETRARMSAASRGRKMSEETKAKLRAIRLGVPLRPEHAAKIAEANTGKKKTPEVIEKTAAFWRGRRHSEDARTKLKASHKKLARPQHPTPKRSVESRAKTSASLKAYYAANGRRSLSPETRMKISTSMKAYRASSR